MFENKYLQTEICCAKCRQTLMKLKTHSERFRWKGNRCKKNDPHFFRNYFNKYEKFIELIDLIYLWCTNTLKTIAKLEFKIVKTIKNWYKKAKNIVKSPCLIFYEKNRRHRKNYRNR